LTLGPQIVNGSAPGNGGYWGIHIDGAAAILKLIDANKPRGWDERQGHRIKMQFVFATVSIDYDQNPSIQSLSHVTVVYKMPHQGGASSAIHGRLDGQV
jgi:hypothetical protein